MIDLASKRKQARTRRVPKIFDTERPLTQAHTWALPSAGSPSYTVPYTLFFLPVLLSYYYIGYLFSKTKSARLAQHQL